MKKNSKYVCSECGSVSPQWLGKCPYCGTFGTLQEEVEEQVGAKVKINAKAPTPLNSIQNEKFERVSTGISELDGVLGGGIVPYSIVLIGGDPGVGKSTILTQVFGNVAKTKKVLYVSAEESLSQVKLRASRLMVDSENFFVLNENKLENIEAVIADYEFIVIDSIQTVYLESVAGSQGSVAQVRECASKLMNIALLDPVAPMVGHVEIFKIKEPACLAGNEQNGSAAVTVDLKLHETVQVAAPMLFIAYLHVSSFSLKL